MSKSYTETKVSDSPPSNRARSGLFFFGLLPALAVAFIVLALGLITRPPEYVARATFVVDWNKMASVPGDDGAEKVRAIWRKEMIARTTALPEAEELSNLLDRDGKLGADDRAVLISQVQKHLRITHADQSGDRDSFAIEFRADNAAQAEAVVNRVLREKRSDIDNQAIFGRVAALAESEKNLDDIDKQRARENGDSGDSDSSGLDAQEFQARSSLIENGVGMWFPPTETVEKVHSENTIGSHVGHVLFAGVFFGGVAGIGGLGFRKIVSARKTPKASAVPPKLPSMNVPPIIARFEIPKPPLLPRG